MYYIGKQHCSSRTAAVLHNRGEEFTLLPGEAMDIGQEEQMTKQLEEWRGVCCGDAGSCSKRVSADGCSSMSGRESMDQPNVREAVGKGRERAKFGPKLPRQCIARPHLGMMFQAIKLLEPARVDMLWRMYNIDYGLIVQEVSKGSNADILGIQKGGVIKCINGKPVSTTIELENTLMITCKGPSGAEVHISGQVMMTFFSAVVNLLFWVLMVKQNMCEEREQ
ncbi:putative serine protease do-like htrA [Hordeum vulgare]|nr:putative serine protease do-like htrA [Hordeum vulgare]